MALNQKCTHMEFLTFDYFLIPFLSSYIPFHSLPTHSSTTLKMAISISKLNPVRPLRSTHTLISKATSTRWPGRTRFAVSSPFSQYPALNNHYRILTSNNSSPSSPSPSPPPLSKPLASSPSAHISSASPPQCPATPLTGPSRSPRSR
jgi:hypothetical protein